MPGTGPGVSVYGELSASKPQKQPRAKEETKKRKAPELKFKRVKDKPQVEEPAKPPEEPQMEEITKKEEEEKKEVREETKEEREEREEREQREKREKEAL